MPPAASRADDIITREPPNIETAWAALQSTPTPLDGFYTRNNFAIPSIAPADWALTFTGFERPLTLRYADLIARPTTTLDVVLECAGNSRSWYTPMPAGTAWRERAVGCARFRGAPLADVLRHIGIPADTMELVFRGADTGAFERSLPREVAQDPQTLLAWEMNGEPLRAEHGAPVRLIVPRWYAVASVKWLVDVRASATPFKGHFQAERYVFARAAHDAHPVPVREKRVNSLVASPALGAEVEAGRPLSVTGWAWSGHAPIARVEVSVDNGAHWHDAELGGQSGVHAWREWRYQVAPRAGSPLVILARAHDAAGNVQPEAPEWNVHGYGYNAPRARTIHVRAAAPVV